MISSKWMLVLFLMIKISMDSACAHYVLPEEMYYDLYDDLESETDLEYEEDALQCPESSSPAIPIFADSEVKAPSATAYPPENFDLYDDLESETDCEYEEDALQCPESSSPAIPIFADSEVKAPSATAYPPENFDDFYFYEDYDLETDSPCQQSGLQCPEGTASSEIPTLADSELTAPAAATYPTIIIDSASETSSPCQQDGIQCPEGSTPSNIPILPDFERPSPKTVRHRVLLFGVLSWTVFMAAILLLPGRISKWLASRRRSTQNEECEMV